MSNYQRARETIRTSIDDEQFQARYPTLAHVDNAREPGEPEDLRTRKIFAAIRDDMPAKPDFMDEFLIHAARLDLQGRPLRHDFSYLDERSPQGKAARTAIASRTNMPFIVANYLGHLSSRHKYLYIATPKAACTTIKHSLQQVEMEGTLVFHRYGEEHFPILSPLLASLDDPELYLGALDGDDWFRFTFVREPFSRVLSCYLDKIVSSVPERERLLPDLGIDPSLGIPSFADFLRAIAVQPQQERDVHWAPQSWLTQPHRIRYDFIGRLERFDADFGQVCRQLGIAAKADSVRHSTGAAERLAAFYGGEEIELVQAIYADDFSDFGYDSRNPLSP